jgi:hypothetical protein
MVASILLVLLIRCYPNTISSIQPAYNGLDLTSETSYTKSDISSENFERKPGILHHQASEIQKNPLFTDKPVPNDYQKYLFSLVFMFLSVTVGFVLGNHQKHLLEDESQDFQDEDCSSKGSTLASPFQSPLSVASDCESNNLPPLLSLCSIDDLIDTGCFKKKFSNAELLSNDGKIMIYKAQHKLDSEYYIVKVMPISLNLMKNGQEKKLFKEINKVKQLKCRHITRYVTCWVEFQDTNVFSDTAEVLLHVQMEYIHGVSLRQWLQTAFNEEKCIRFLTKISKVIKFIHSKGLAHGNISLDNIYIDKYHWITIGDFEFNKTKQDDITQFLHLTMEMLGSVPKYSLPSMLLLVKSLDLSHSIAV